MTPGEFFPPQKKRVLVVDDDDTQRDFLKLGLAAKNYEVVCATGGQEALDLAREAHFDYVLSDIMMPGMSGIDFLTEFKRLQPKVPVVMSTAKSTLERAMECVKRGAFDYIPKPVSIKDLHEIFDRAAYLDDVKVKIGDLEDMVKSIPPFLSQKVDEFNQFIENLSGEIAHIVKQSYDGFPADQMKAIRAAERQVDELKRIAKSIQDLNKPPKE